MKYRTHTLRRLMAMTLPLILLGGCIPSGRSALAGASTDWTLPTHPTPEAEWETVSTLIGRHYGRWDDAQNPYPHQITGTMPNTALLGNGALFASSGGAIDEKTFRLSLHNFWETRGEGGSSALRLGGVTILAEGQGGNGGAPADENLARLATTVTASSSHEQFQPQRAIDGTVTANSGLEGWVSVNSGIGVNEWLALEFAQPVTFRRFRLMSDAWSRGQAYAGDNTAAAFDIQISDNGTAWTTVYSVNGNSDAVVDRDLETPPPPPARWVRVLFRQPQQSLYAQQRARVAAFELYAQPGAPGGNGPVPTPDPAERPFLEIMDIVNAQVDTDKAIGGMPLRMETIVPANHNLLITRITNTASDGAARPLRVETWVPAEGQRPTTAEVAGDAVRVSRTTQPPQANFNNMGVRNGWRSRGVLTTKIIGDVAVQAGIEAENSRAYLSFELAPGQTVYAVTAAGGGGRTYRWDENQDTLHVNAQLQSLIPNPEYGITPEDDAAAWLAAVNNPADIAAIRENHRGWWRDFWLQSWIDLDDADPRMARVLRFYYGAQYQLGMAMREGFIPAGFSPWVTTDSPAWSNDWHMNYNFQSIWYGAFSGNRTELVRPAIEAVRSYMEVGRRRAESTEQLRRIPRSNMHTVGSQPPHTPQNFPPHGRTDDINYVDYRISQGTIHATDGIQGGLLFPVGIGPWGTTPDNQFHAQTMGAPFSAYLMIQYFNYNPHMDTVRLAEFYEFVKAAAIFGMNWMDEMDDGTVIMMAGYNEASWSINPAGELALYKMVFDGAVRMSQALDVDLELRTQWRDMRARMAPQPRRAFQHFGEIFALSDERFRINPRQWELHEDPRPGDGNMLVLESIVPADILGFFSEEAEIQIGHNTLAAFGPNAFRVHNNTPKTFPMAARLGYNPSNIIDHLLYLTHGTTSGIINSGTPGPSPRMAENMRLVDYFHGMEKVGATAAINYLMLQGHLDTVILFPNWIEGRSARFTRLRAPGGFVFSAAYDGATDMIEPGVQVVSDAGGTLNLVHPWQEEYASILVLDSQGRPVNTTRGTAPNNRPFTTFSFDTQAGAAYYIFPQDRYTFFPVTDVRPHVPEVFTVGPRLLNATVSPARATNQAIVWSVVSPGSTGAVISANLLTTSAPGWAVIRATIADGVAEGVDFVRDFPLYIFDFAVPPTPPWAFEGSQIWTGGSEAERHNIGIGGDGYFNAFNVGGWLRFENIDLGTGLGRVDFVMNLPYHINNLQFSMRFQNGAGEDITIPMNFGSVGPRPGENVGDWGAANNPPQTHFGDIPAQYKDRLTGPGWTVTLTVDSFSGHLNLRSIILRHGWFQAPSIPPLAGDLNQDGFVNAADIHTALKAWGGETAEADLLTVLDNWGRRNPF